MKLQSSLRPQASDPGFLSEESWALPCYEIEPSPATALEERRGWQKFQPLTGGERDRQPGLA